MDKMEAAGNVTESQGESAKSPGGDGFSEVRRKRPRRGRPSGMDTTESDDTPVAKRPSFGPVDASTTLVSAHKLEPGPPLGSLCESLGARLV